MIRTGRIQRPADIKRPLDAYSEDFEFFEGELELWKKGDRRKDHSGDVQNAVADDNCTLILEPCNRDFMLKFCGLLRCEAGSHLSR